MRYTCNFLVTQVFQRIWKQYVESLKNTMLKARLSKRLTLVRRQEFVASHLLRHSYMTDLYEILTNIPAAKILIRFRRMNLPQQAFPIFRHEPRSQSRTLDQRFCRRRFRLEHRMLHDRRLPATMIVSDSRQFNYNAMSEKKKKMCAPWLSHKNNK